MKGVWFLKETQRKQQKKNTIYGWGGLGVGGGPQHNLPTKKTIKTKRANLWEGPGSPPHIYIYIYMYIYMYMYIYIYDMIR